MASSNDKKPDIARPGKSAPSATARPIIVGHKTLPSDPMVGATKIVVEEKAPAEEQVAETPHTEKVIQPPTASKPEPAKEAKPAEAESAQPVSDDAAVAQAVAEQAGGKKKDGEPTEEDIKRQTAVQKLIEEKTYFVPIKAAHKKRNVRATWILLILLVVALGGAYAAADAGLFDPGFKLPVDLIKN